MAREEAYFRLMGGIQQLEFKEGCVPSDLVLIGDHAFPLAMNPRGQVLMAASSYGQGRIVALGHEKHLTDFPAVVMNALRWLVASPDRSEVGVHPSCKAVADNLSYSGVKARVCEVVDAGLGVYVTDAYSVATHEKELVSFLKGGGGLLVAGQAWSWAERNPGENSMLGFPGNKVCSVAGIYFSEHYGEVGTFPVPHQIPSSWLAVSIGKDFKDDFEFLLKGVSEFDIQGGAVASEVLVHGPLSFPIGVTPDGRAFIAGAYYGQGRVIVTTHEGFLGRDSLSPFFANALRWLDEGRGGTVGVEPRLKNTVPSLSKSGLKCQVTDFKEDLSVYVCTSYSDARCQDIQDFVAEGGGLLIGGHAWYWAQSHSGQNAMTGYPGNHILNKMGLCILGDTLKAGLYKVPDLEKACSEAYHFRGLLRRFASHVTEGKSLTQHEQGCLKKLGSDCGHYLAMENHGCAAYTSMVTMLTDMVKQAGVPQVCHKCPVKSAKDHLLLNVGSQVYKVCKDPDALLPFIIKEQPSLPVVYNTKVPISVNAAGGQEWVSTGLYLCPGMRTYMSMPPEIVGKGWKVQIGCQTDYIGNSNELKRAPRVCECFPVDKEMVLVNNLWGGLVYLIAPGKSKVDAAEVVVQIAVQAPYYKSGVTTVEDWVQRVRQAPAPWAELEFENIILTLHSEFIRKLDRPDEVAALWDGIMKGIADLAAKPHKFPRKERFVADVQISHGFMHAGYPVMMHSSSAAGLVNPKSARTSGLWGAVHELGHNQQRGVWEFPPHTTECTCNLWSVYVHENVLGLDRSKAHPNMTKEKRQGRARDYAKGGRQLGKWSVWTALETYMQLQDTFGWDAFKQVFKEYHSMTGVPNNNKGKMNTYAETFSKVVNKNLAPFFKAWGWPIEPSTEQKLASLPAWSDHPMAQYA